MLNLEISQLRVSLLVLRAFLVYNTVLCTQFLKVEFKLAGTALCRLGPAAVVLLPVFHHGLDSFNLSSILVTLVLHLKVLLNYLIVFTTKALNVTLIAREDVINSRLEKLFQR